MEYANGLKALRQRLIEGSTGQAAPEMRGLESFVPPRPTTPVFKEEPEDLMARTATWLSDIKKASAEFKKAYNELSSQKRPAPNPLTAAAKGFLKQAEAMDEGKEEKAAKLEAERKEAFISRREKDSPSMFAPQRPSETPIPTDAEMPNVLNALAAVESRGSGDYEAVGPVVKKGMYKGQRAYGRYQVMEGNIGDWTEAAIGRRLTTEEFVASPEAQDAVASHQLQMSKDKYGTWEDAVSVWFSGKPVSKAGKASDGYLTVPEYINKFRRNFVRT
jgi:hypothetical protein